jgi:hypothetical protein
LGVVGLLAVTVRIVCGAERNNDNAGKVYIPTLGAKNAPKMGHPLVYGWVRRTGNSKGKD